jgi:hypothetical protein
MRRQLAAAFRVSSRWTKQKGERGAMKTVERIERREGVGRLQAEPRIEAPCGRAATLPETLDRLVLAVHEATRPFAGIGPLDLGDRLRRAAVAAAAASLDAGRPPHVEQLRHVRSVLRELAYYVDLGERLGYFDLGAAVELFELEATASLELSVRMRRMAASTPPAAGALAVATPAA